MEAFPTKLPENLYEWMPNYPYSCLRHAGFELAQLQRCRSSPGVKLLLGRATTVGRRAVIFRIGGWGGGGLGRDNVEGPRNAERWSGLELHEGGFRGISLGCSTHPRPWPWGSAGNPMANRGAPPACASFRCLRDAGRWKWRRQGHSLVCDAKNGVGNHIVYASCRVVGRPLFEMRGGGHFPLFKS